jgi:hypothetical protein
MFLCRQRTGCSRCLPAWAVRSVAIGAGICVTLWQLWSGAAFAQRAIAVAPAAVPVATQPDADGFVAADAAELGSDWVRLVHDDKGQIIGMQTAIVRYVSPAAAPGEQPVEVDLIGAVHIGDAAYYAQLNEQFAHYDALLYELVAPQGVVVERGEGTSNSSPVGALQNGAKTLLGLDHQLEQIDYTKKNFVHADISPDEFLQAMKDRNESFLEMYFRLLGQSLAQQSEMAAKGQSLDLELISALFAADRPRRLKIALAKQLSEMESLMVGFGGQNGSVLISERNKRALDVLRKQSKAGKHHLAIFYGAGHLSDMDERLRKDFGMRPVGVKWLTAWNLAP